MFILGHTGIAVAAVRAVCREAPIAAVAVAAVLPDLVDKPVAYFFPDFAQGWTRLAAHSLTGFLVFSGIAAAFLRARAAPLVFAYALHIALDLHFMDRPIFLWPAYGWIPPPYPEPYWDRFFAKFGHPYTLGGEALGIAAWTWVWFSRRAARPAAGAGAAGAPSVAASGTPPAPPPPAAAAG